jgi:hypothetical protein
VVVWGALSLAWSLSRDQTFENVARLAMLAAAAVIGATYAARPRAALSLSGALAASGGLLALIIEFKFLDGTTGLFVGSRLSWPIDYANADAALLWLPVPCLLAFAAAEPLRPLIRGASACLAALGCAIGFTAQSRGGAIALGIALFSSAAIARDHARFILTTLATLIPVALVLPALVSGDPSNSSSVARAHGEAALVAATVAGVLSVSLAMLDRRRRFPFGGREKTTAVAVGVFLALVGAGLFVSKTGRPNTWLRERWREFATVQPTPIGGVSHFGTGTSNRFDYWRVAWQAFRDHPIDGVGSGAFSVPWFRARAIDENISDAHSWEAGALAETGTVGFLLLGGALLLPLVRIRSARSERGAWPIAAIGVGGASVYFVVHASLDWLFRVPAVALPGFVALGAIATGGKAGRLRLAKTQQRVVFAVVSVMTAAATIPLYASTAEVTRAEGDAAQSPRAAAERLDRATWLNPFSIEPLIVRASLLRSAGAPLRARDAAVEATVRAPKDWRAWAALLTTASALNPTSPDARVARQQLMVLNPRAALVREKVR